MKTYILILLVLSGCSEIKNSKEITKEQYGDKWPFSVDKGRLRCEDGMVIFESQGSEYGVNGLAKSKYTHDIIFILQNDEQYGEMNGHPIKKDIQQIIDDGRKLCD